MRITFRPSLIVRLLVKVSRVKLAAHSASLGDNMTSKQLIKYAVFKAPMGVATPTLWGARMANPGVMQPQKGMNTFQEILMGALGVMMARPRPGSKVDFLPLTYPDFNTELKRPQTSHTDMMRRYHNESPAPSATFGTTPLNAGRSY